MSIKIWKQVLGMNRKVTNSLWVCITNFSNFVLILESFKINNKLI